MDTNQLERIIQEEVQKVLAEQERNEGTLFPPNPNETLDASACQGPTCVMPTGMNPVPAPAIPPAVDDGGPAILCLFTGAREKWDVIGSAFQTWRSEGFRLDAVFSRGAQDVIPSDEITSLGLRQIDRPDELWTIMYEMNRYAAVFVPSISRTHAAKLALGITDTVILNLMLSALAQNTPTIASDDGLSPTACVVCGNNVPGIQEVLDKYQEQLRKMGMKLAPAEEAVKEVGRVVLNKAESGPDLITTLVTEEDAAAMQGPVVKAARGGLITPLALELLHKRGIEVVIVPQD